MGTTSQKIQYLGETKSLIKDSINLTGANIGSNDTFRSYAVKLRDGLLDIINNGTATLYNNFPKVSGTGSNISLSNTLEAPMFMNKFDGDTFQQTYSGKNLFNKNSITSGYLIEPSRGTESANASYGCSDYIPVKANTQYTRVYCNNWYGAFYDENKNYVEAIQNKNVITPSVDGYARISFLLTNKDIVQLEQGSTSTSYEPYVGGIPSPNPSYPQDIQCVEGIQNITVDDGNGNSQTQEVNLGDIKLYNGDYITGTPDNWSIVRENGVVVFDGSETWLKNGYSFVIVLSIGKPISLCSHFTDSSTSWGSLNEAYRGKYTTTNQDDRFKCMPLIDMTIEEFKTWLSNNNVTLVYKLATPTTTSITDTYLISQLNALYNAKSKNGQTNITVSGQLPMILEVSALKDEI